MHTEVDASVYEHLLRAAGVQLPWQKLLKLTAERLDAVERFEIAVAILVYFKATRKTKQHAGWRDKA